MKLLRSYSYSLLYQSLNVAIPFLTIPYLARVLGPTALGRFAYINAVFVYFAFLAGFALSVYGNREIAKVRSDAVALSEVFSRLFSLQVYTSLVSFAAYLAFMPSFDLGPQGLALKIAFGFQVVACALDVSWYFMGVEEMRAIAVRNLFAKVVGLTLTFALVRGERDLPIYAWVVAGSVVSGNLYTFVLAMRSVRFRLRGPRETFAGIKGAWGIFIPQLVMVLYGNADRLFIGYFSLPAELAVYDQGMKVVTILIAFTFSLRPIMIARLSMPDSVLTTQEKGAQYVRLFAIIGFIAHYLCFGVIGASSRFVPWFFGSKFLELGSVLPVLAVILVVCSYGDVMINQIMVALGRERQILVVLLIMFVAAFSCYALLIPRYGAMGAALSLVACNTLIMGVEWYFLRDVLAPGPILKTFARDLSAGLAMACAIFAVGWKLPPVLATTFLQIAAGTAVYVAVQLHFRHFILLKLAALARDAIASRSARGGASDA